MASRNHLRALLPAAIVCPLLAAPACVNSSRGHDSGMPEVQPFTPGPSTIDLSRTHQRIDGFGASSAWTTTKLTDAMAEALFSSETGLGLSLLRLRIAPSGTTAEIATAQKAAKYGVALWAAPWSPPAEWKSNQNTEEGGSLLPEYRQAWADRLAGFAKQMTNQGLPLVALSVQNEPGFIEKWETCEWEPADLVAFVRDNLGPALEAQSLTTPLMAPESQSWGMLVKYAGPLLADPQAARYIGVVATHAYGYSTTPAFLYTPAVNAGKPVWETEVSDPIDTYDPGIGSALRVAKMIHDHLVDAEVSAWHYWWITPVSPNTNGALLDAGQLTRRAYALGNWSRFVRPGYLRVDATAHPMQNVYVTAFTGPPDGRLVIVAVNQGTVDAEQQFIIEGADVAQVTPWITSADQALSAGTPVAVAGGSFTVTLAAQSVTTFVQSYGVDGGAEPSDGGADASDAGD